MILLFQIQTIISSWSRNVELRLSEIKVSLQLFIRIDICELVMVFAKVVDSLKIAWLKNICEEI